MDRPEGVPEGASFNEADGVWEYGPSRANERHGNWQVWRDSGEKLEEVRYKDGKRHGPYKRFHASGDIARQGSYRDDALHGTAVHKRDKGGGGDDPWEGVSGSVWRSEIDYDMGRVLAVRHFDEDGNRVLKDGTELPKQPRGVPSVATYDVETERWLHGQMDDNDERTGHWMWWAGDGTLVEESEFKGGHRQGVTRRYDAEGVLLEEGSYFEGKKTGTWSEYEAETGKVLKKADYDDDQFHGSYIEYGPDGRSRVRIEYENGKRSGQFLARCDKNKYRGGKIRVEKGHFKDDVPVGRWKLLDKNLKPVFTVDFGVPRTDEDEVAQSPVFDDTPRSADDWTAMSEQYGSDRIVGESLLACARATAASGDGGLLGNALDERIAPLAPDAAEALADEILDDHADSFAALTGALVQGAEPARVLQAIAIALDRRGRPLAARDYVDAALHVAPQMHSLHYTRALVNISLGESGDALTDADALEEDEPESATFLRAYVSALFPRYDFWPEHALLDDGDPPALVRSAPEVADVVARYATRFEAVRQQLLKRTTGIMAWAPPDPAPLLKDGPVALNRDGAVDEIVDVAELDLPRLLSASRANWAALVWIAWATSHRRPQLPVQLTPHPQLASARAQAAERHRWARQRLTPGEDPDGDFSWNGVKLSAMSPHLAEVCLAEWEETDRVLRWLCDEALSSPFVIDLPDG
jgi:antitoxin component YwqK of YwqJK toxin-antitoxin module